MESLATWIAHNRRNKETHVVYHYYWKASHIQRVKDIATPPLTQYKVLWYYSQLILPRKIKWFLKPKDQDKPRQNLVFFVTINQVYLLLLTSMVNFIWVSFQNMSYVICMWQYGFPVNCCQITWYVPCLLQFLS